MEIRRSKRHGKPWVQMCGPRDVHEARWFEDVLEVMAQQRRPFAQWAREIESVRGMRNSIEAMAREHGWQG